MRLIAGGLALAVLATAGCMTSPGRDALVQRTDCAPIRFDIYFATDQAGLTPVAEEAVRLGASQVAGCAIDRVRVLGLADAQGAPSANLDLSERRARSVTAALEADGLPVPTFEVQAAGASGATTPQGANAPMRRRTEVLIEARPR